MKEVSLRVRLIIFLALFALFLSFLNSYTLVGQLLANPSLPGHYTGPVSKDPVKDILEVSRAYSAVFGIKDWCSFAKSMSGVFFIESGGKQNIKGKGSFQGSFQMGVPFVLSSLKMMSKGGDLERMGGKVVKKPTDFSTQIDATVYGHILSAMKDGQDLGPSRGRFHHLYSTILAVAQHARIEKDVQRLFQNQQERTAVHELYQFAPPKTAYILKTGQIQKSIPVLNNCGLGKTIPFINGVKRIAFGQSSCTGKLLKGISAINCQTPAGYAGPSGYGVVSVPENFGAQDIFVPPSLYEGRDYTPFISDPNDPYYNLEIESRKTLQELFGKDIGTTSKDELEQEIQKLLNEKEKNKTEDQSLFDRFMKNLGFGNNTEDKQDRSQMLERILNATTSPMAKFTQEYLNRLGISTDTQTNQNTFDSSTGANENRNDINLNTDNQDSGSFYNDNYSENGYDSSLEINSSYISESDIAGTQINLDENTHQDSAETNGSEPNYYRRGSSYSSNNSSETLGTNNQNTEQAISFQGINNSKEYGQSESLEPNLQNSSYGNQDQSSSDNLFGQNDILYNGKSKQESVFDVFNRKELAVKADELGFFTRYNSKEELNKYYTHLLNQKPSINPNQYVVEGEQEKQAGLWQRFWSWFISLFSFNIF